MTPLKSIANATTPDAQTILIQPFDKGAINDIERALMMSDLGLTPGNDGNAIRLNIPSLTADRRKELAKVVSKLGEDGKVAIRNVRRDALKSIGSWRASARTKSSPSRTRSKSSRARWSSKSTA